MEEKRVVKISNLIMSPYKDLILNPTTKEQLDWIIKSYNRIGERAFHIRGREVNNGIEIFTGHKSVEAAENMGFSEVPVYIDFDISDELARECFIQYNHDPIRNKVGLALETYKLRFNEIIAIRDINDGKITETSMDLAKRFGIKPNRKELAEIISVDSDPKKLDWLNYCRKTITDDIDKQEIEIIEYMIKTGYILKEASLWDNSSIRNLLKDVPKDEREHVYPSLNMILEKARINYEEHYPPCKNKISQANRLHLISEAINGKNLTHSVNKLTNDLLNKRYENNVKPTKGPKDRSIYIAQDRIAGYLKIGRTSDFAARLKTMSTFACYEALEEFECRFNSKIEAEIHATIPVEMRISLKLDCSPGHEIYDLKYKEEILNIVRSIIEKYNSPRFE